MGKMVICFDGNLGKDAEYKNERITFSVAHSFSVKNANGEYETKTAWVSVKAFKKCAEVLANRKLADGTPLLSKGVSVVVTNAEVTATSYIDKEGNEKPFLEVCVNNAYDVYAKAKEASKDDSNGGQIPAQAAPAQAAPAQTVPQAPQAAIPTAGSLPWA